MAFVPVPPPCADGNCLISHVDLDDRVGLSLGQRERLRAAIAAQGVLADVVRWIAELSPPGELVDVVQQDEYTLDVIVRATLPDEDGSGLGRAVHLVYDTT